MPIRPCPTCHAQTERSSSTSLWAWVNYYKCKQCECVWTTPVDNPDATPTITVKGKPPAA